MTESGDTGKTMVTEPSEEETIGEVLIIGEVQRGVGAESCGGAERRECWQSSQETGRSEEEVASGSCQRRASWRLVLSSVLCRVPLGLPGWGNPCAEGSG